MKENLTVSIDKELIKKFKIKLIENDIKNLSYHLETIIKKYLEEK
jgi:metal-responsive CopG/Arc/MetJ family transcriptional regulator